jgi:hypothetical protein
MHKMLVIFPFTIRHQSTTVVMLSVIYKLKDDWMMISEAQRDHIFDLV